MGLLADSGITPEQFERDLTLQLQEWSKLPDDHNTRMDKEDALFFASAMLVEVVKEEQALQTPGILDAFYDLATKSQASFLRERGLDLMHEMAEDLPAYAGARTLAAAEALVADRNTDVAAHGVFIVAQMAMEKLPGAEKAGEIVAAAMGATDKNLRRTATITFAQHYPYLVKSADDWDQNLSHVFKAAAAKNNVPGPEVAEAEASVTQMRDLLSHHRKPKA